MIAYVTDIHKLRLMRGSRYGVEVINKSKLQRNKSQFMLLIIHLIDAAQIIHLIIPRITDRIESLCARIERGQSDNRLSFALAN